MTTKNDKEMSIKVDLRDKYDRKALTFINGFHRYGLISIKKSFVDRRRKYSSTVTGPLKPKYTRPFKKARAKAEFNDFFALESNETKLSGRSWTTYTHDISSHPRIKGHGCSINERLNTLIPIATNRMNHHSENNEYKYQWMFSTEDETRDYTVSTKAYADLDQASKEFKEKMKLHCNTYLVKDITKLHLVKRHTPAALIGQVGKSDTMAKATWLEKSPNTKIHCGYASILIAQNGKFTEQYIEEVKNEYDSSKLAKHVQELITNFKKWCQNPKNKNIVGNYKMPEDHVDQETLRLLAVYKKRPIHVYDNLYAIKEGWKFKGEPKSPATIRKQKQEGIYRKPIEIRLKNHGAVNHFHALLRWKDIKELGYTKEAQLEQERKRKEDGDAEETVIKTVVRPKAKNTKKLIAWDIEASPDQNDGNKFKCYAVGMAWLNAEGKMKYKKAFGRDALSKLLEFLYKNREEFNGYYMYAHNGGAFDFTVLMNDCLLNHDKWKLNCTNNSAIEQSGSWISAVMETEVDGKTYSITMRDSVRMLPGTLDSLTKELKVKHQKLPETVDHDEIAHFMNANNFDTTRLLSKYPDIEKYLQHDCLGLLEVVLAFSDVVFKASYRKGKKKIKVKGGHRYQNYEGGLDMVNLLTGATLAKKMFYLKYYDRFKRPLYKLSVKNDKFIRHSYLGGRTEVLYKCGKCDGDKWWSFDFTSLYPAMCAKHDMPYGKPEPMNKSNWALHGTKSSTWTKDQRRAFDNFFGFAQVKVRTLRPDIVPLHGIKAHGKLHFPIMETWTQTTLFSEEIKLGLEEGQYEYIIGDAIQFQRGKILKEFMSDGFKKKAEAKSQNQAALAQVWKIIINSGYGFFGLRTQDRDGIEIHELGSPRVLLDDEQIISEADFKNYTIIRKKKNLPIEDFNVGVASAVTAWARMRLFRLIRAIHKHGGKVAYVDTDSVKCNIDVLNTPALRKEFMWDGTGDELGSLKNECNEEMEKAVKKAKKAAEKSGDYTNYNKVKKDHDHHMKVEKGSLHFDSLITYQAKFYSCEKTLLSGKKLDMSKCKGHNGKKMKHDDFEDETGSSFTKVKMKQFLKPKSGMVSESDPWSITLKSINKTFNRLRKYKFDRKTKRWVDNGVAYTKGQVDSRGYVTPNII